MSHNMAVLSLSCHPWSSSEGAVTHAVSDLDALLQPVDGPPIDLKEIGNGQCILASFKSPKCLVPLSWNESRHSADIVTRMLNPGFGMHFRGPVLVNITCSITCTKNMEKTVTSSIFWMRFGDKIFQFSSLEGMKYLCSWMVGDMIKILWNGYFTWTKILKWGFVCCSVCYMIWESKITWEI